MSIDMSVEGKNLPAIEPQEPSAAAQSISTADQLAQAKATVAEEDRLWEENKKLRAENSALQPGKPSSNTTDRRSYIKRRLEIAGVAAAGLGALAIGKPDALKNVRDALFRKSSSSVVPGADASSGNVYIDNTPSNQETTEEGTEIERDPLKVRVEGNGELVVLKSKVELETTTNLKGTEFTYTQQYPQGMEVFVKEQDENGEQKFDDEGDPLQHVPHMKIKDGKASGDIHDFLFENVENRPYHALTLLPVQVNDNGEVHSVVKAEQKKENITTNDTYEFDYPVHVHANYTSRTGKQEAKLISQITPDEKPEIVDLLTEVDKHFAPFTRMEILPHVFVTSQPVDYNVNFEQQEATDTPQMGFVYDPVELVTSNWQLDSSYDAARRFVESLQGLYGTRHSEARSAETEWADVNTYLRNKGLELYPESQPNSGESPVPQALALFMPDRYNDTFTKSVSPFSNFPSVEHEDRFAEWFTAIRHFGKEIVGEDGKGGRYQEAVAGKLEEEVLAKLYFTSCYKLLSSVAETPDAQQAIISHIEVLKDVLLMPDEEYKAMVDSLPRP